MDERPFEQVQKDLTDQFVRDEPATETDEELGNAVLGVILQSERLRHGVEASGPKQAEVDRETINRLYNQTELGPEHVFAESIFKRLAVDPASAMRHYRQAIDQRNRTQSQRAKSARPRSYDSITRLINDIVRDDPALKTTAVLDELAAIDGIIISDGEIRNTQDAETMKVSNLPSRVSDARKRFSG
ncbi:hypothetical protein [Novosphingobium sp.]|jgi:hypothetical protein|uniref:hypothetical protein n=1 Tax=Novosphingobium sp. TaxID=1874826 RepID=UPI0022C41044|nr:hypothetical protein [Novosphingobium sp.]MCZ8018847.1 hypothetical protein [Novosphingobium sp.]MCZ8034453.1 hypothetical protein [Novosphingobium sp.]MCZ8052001.1 hypothetical protein [Novosphingobium sp.]MCZ8059928.1 hypothetical protein [Novosphingobium sp.]MCZ8230889.1 hypothetical protein [Novosphingobium sp.]